MTQEEQRALAKECGATYEDAQRDCEVVIFLSDELAAYTAAVESKKIMNNAVDAYQAGAESKQAELDKANARNAQLESLMREFALLDGYRTDGSLLAREARSLMEIPRDTWLSEHAKAVESTVAEREYLMALKEYIERAELYHEADALVPHVLERMIADGDMPAVYDETLRRIAALDA